MLLGGYFYDEDSGGGLAAFWRTGDGDAVLTNGGIPGGFDLKVHLGFVAGFNGDEVGRDGDAGHGFDGQVNVAFKIGSAFQDNGDMGSGALFQAFRGRNADAEFFIQRNHSALAADVGTAPHGGQ